MNSIYIVEMVTYLEAHDDFNSDYEGEHKDIWEGKFFRSAEEAWKALKSRFSMRKNGNNDEIVFKGEYMSFNGEIYGEWHGYVEDMHSTDWLNEEKKEISLRTSSSGDSCTLRIRELKPY